MPTMTEKETIQSYLHWLINHQPDTPSWAEITRRVYQATNDDIHETTLRNALRADRTPSAKTLRAFAAVLEGADLAHMLRLAGYLNEAESREQPALQARTLDLARILDQLDTEDKDIIERMIRRIAELRYQRSPEHPQQDAEQ